MKFDFSGWATKVGVKCGDGRTILKDAFKHMNGKKVPLVWQHLHDDPSNILGHAILESRDEGVYAYCKFNDSDAARDAKEAVFHGDIDALSIYANELKQKNINGGKAVIHGVIKELSLVLSGSNPEALIENLSFAHGDGSYVTDDTEALIYTGLNLDPTPIDFVAHSVGMSDVNDQIALLNDRQRSRVYDEIVSSLDYQQRNVIQSIIDTMNAQQRAALYTTVAEALKHGQTMASEETLIHAATHADDATVQDVIDTMDEMQKNVMYALIASAIESGGSGEDVTHSELEGDNDMKYNVFQQNSDDQNSLKHAFTLDDFKEILTEAQRGGGKSLKECVLAHAESRGYGIDNIEALFPEAQLVRNTPDTIARNDDWVEEFLRSVFKTPFSRIKSTAMDITSDEARAKGYITGNKKVDEIIKALKRITTPTTIYKRQTLDRDDVIDITDFEIIAWMKSELKRLLKEEIARAALIGDGRPAESKDHINTENIRPVWGDNEVYTTPRYVSESTTTIQLIDEVVRARKNFKGTGRPNFYTYEEILTDMLLVTDLNQRRIYKTEEELAAAMRVEKIIPVEPMEGQTRDVDIDGSTVRVSLIGILLNPRDYTLGADKGGETTMFDGFDIDWNKHKYLLETRSSGALTRPKSAVTIEKRSNG